MKLESQFYSVQPLALDGSKDGGLISTDASSALRAAEKVLGENLSLHGRTPRAQVWVMDDGYQPVLLLLYAAESFAGITVSREAG
jgi:hypothetical protein